MINDPFYILVHGTSLLDRFLAIFPPHFRVLLILRTSLDLVAAELFERGFEAGVQVRRQSGGHGHG